MSQFEPDPGWMGDPRRGASMGRDGWGAPEAADFGSVRVFRVEIDEDGYDDGGAYWGLPTFGESLWCAWSEIPDEYRRFAWAKSREQAIALLGIEQDLLKEENREPAGN